MTIVITPAVRHILILTRISMRVLHISMLVTIMPMVVRTRMHRLQSDCQRIHLHRIRIGMTSRIV